MKKALIIIAFAFASSAAFATEPDMDQYLYETCAPVADSYAEVQLAAKFDDDNIFAERCFITEHGPVCEVAAIAADGKVSTYSVRLNNDCSKIEVFSLISAE